VSAERDLPEGWVLETEQTTHDQIMGRDYTTVLYRQEDTRSAVYINEVIDGENVWKYNVHRSGLDGDRGTTPDLETAKEMAVAFMSESADSA
jgi:hypothetical protein